MNNYQYIRIQQITTTDKTMGYSYISTPYKQISKLPWISVFEQIGLTSFLFFIPRFWNPFFTTVSII